MPTDPNHRALLKAVASLTTQVRRIADTLEPPVVVADLGGQTTSDDATQPQLMGDGTPLPWPTPPYKLCSASSHGALDATVGPCVLRYCHDGPVHVAADGTSWAQTTGHDAPAWTLCTCGDKPITAQHPEPCPLSRELYASQLAEMHGAPLITRTIAHWGPVCESGRHHAHALQTCDEIDAFTAFVQDRMQQQSAAEWKKTAAVYSGLHTTAEDEVRDLTAKLENATATLKRVRALHARITVQTTGGPKDACATCESDAMSHPWPCPTTEALAGPTTDR